MAQYLLSLAETHGPIWSLGQFMPHRNMYSNQPAKIHWIYQDALGHRNLLDNSDLVSRPSQTQGRSDKDIRHF